LRNNKGVDMKNWYCPHCERFKSFKRTVAGFEGYPDRYYCRCCGTELLDVRYLLRLRDEKYIRDLAKEENKNES
jgi:rubredoxin